MSIDLKRRFGFAFFAVLVFSMMGPLRSGAVTVEEEDADSASPVPTVSQPAGGPSAGALAASPENKSARVRISEKIGFYYFLRSGFLVSDDSKVSPVGNVLGSSNNGELYQTGDKNFVDLSQGQNELKPGDLLVVYRLGRRLDESHSGFSGIWVRNLAVVKVLEVEKKRCYVEAKKSFFPFKAGDKVRLYDDEIKRWKQAQVKKALPDHPVSGFVTLAEPNDLFAVQTDFIVLTVGSKKGVVEGQRFLLKKTLYTGGPPAHGTQGLAQVFYVGSNYSMAQVIYSDEPIRKGFEAVYQP